MSASSSTRLSALDAMFVGIETSELHMHVGAVLVFEAGPLATPDGGIDSERIAQRIEQALTKLPNYRQRLKKTPGLKHPVWVDDSHFALHYHLRHTALPKPGGARLLKRLAGRIFSQSLDRQRPLWEMWVVEGLGADTFAIIAKVHHAMIDGMGGVQVLAEILRGTPTAPPVAPSPSWHPAKHPGSYELFVSEYQHRRAGLANLARRGREYLESLKDSGGSGAKDIAAGLLNIAKSGLVPAPQTSINPVRVSPHRRFDYCHYELSQIKFIKNQLGGKINDAMLALCAGGLRRFLNRRGDRVRQLEGFRILMPVSTRSSEARARGNQITLAIVPLPVHIEDALLRYQAAHASASEIKDASHQAESVALIEEVADVSSDALLRESVRLAGALRPFNVVVTNVPGPPFPLYLLGAKLKEMVPLVPLFNHQGLGIALFSYDGTMTMGFGADWHALPDLHLLVEDFDASFQELYKLAKQQEPQAHGE